MDTSSLLSYYPETCALNASFKNNDASDRENPRGMERLYWPLDADTGKTLDYNWPIASVYGSSTTSNVCSGRPCWNNCSDVGRCWNGHCKCPCNRIGFECEDEIKLHELAGLSGSVTAKNEETKDSDGVYEAFDLFNHESPEWWFFIPINPKVKSIKLDTCSDETDFPTTILLLSSCPHADGIPYFVEAEEQLDSECDHGLKAAKISISMEDDIEATDDDDGQKGFFGAVEGWDSSDSEGTFQLSWEIKTLSPGVSPSPTRDPLLPNLAGISPTASPSNSDESSSSSDTLNYVGTTFIIVLVAFFSLVFGLAFGFKIWRKRQRTRVRVQPN